MSDATHDCMYRRRYWEIQAILDRALGDGEHDGTGEGIVEEVALLAAQRDDARRELQRLKRQQGWFG